MIDALHPNFGGSSMAPIWVIELHQPAVGSANFIGSSPWRDLKDLIEVLLSIPSSNAHRKISGQEESLEVPGLSILLIFQYRW